VLVDLSGIDTLHRPYIDITLISALFSFFCITINFQLRSSVYVIVVVFLKTANDILSSFLIMFQKCLKHNVWIGYLYLQKGCFINGPFITL